MKKILIVDDEAGIRQLLCDALELEGYKTDVAENGMEAIAKLKEQPDLILLDINLPDMDGYEICRAIRDYVSAPILFLTARAEEADRVRGLRVGGDDYIVKPFGMEELLARVGSHFRREERMERQLQREMGGCHKARMLPGNQELHEQNPEGKTSDSFWRDPGMNPEGRPVGLHWRDPEANPEGRPGNPHWRNPEGRPGDPHWRDPEANAVGRSQWREREVIGGGLVIDYPGCRILKDGTDAGLTRTEYRIAELLFENRGRVFGREQIYERVRGYDSSGDAGIVTEHIRRIRKKLGDQDGKPWIETVWGVGYQWIG